MSLPSRARVVLAVSFFLGLLVPACAEEEPQRLTLGDRGAELTKEQRMGRYATVRDAVNARGLEGKGYMWAGIAYQETGLSQCWSELTWACKGPSSPDCGGGPVVAGAGDGPCSLQQGGLGMFQFDGWTFDQTLKRDGDQILTVAGNVNRAVDFVLNMVRISAHTSNSETPEKAAQWIRDFDPNNATLRKQWITTVTHYYNGCPPGGSCFPERYSKYDAGLQIVLDESGLPFWGGVAPGYKGTFVGQGFPFASQPFVLAPGEVKPGFLEMKNEGKEPWRKGEVFLGTSNPRDGASALAAPGWTSPTRAATVDQDTAPGAVGRFTFAVKGPDKAGEYPQFFNLVREGVAWFSDGGQGGPPDDILQVKVTVQTDAPPPPPSCPAGTGPAFSCAGSERVRCDPSSGKIVKEACANGCSASPDGAVCGAPVPSPTGGQAGKGGTGSATGGQSGKGGGSAAGKGGASAGGGNASGGRSGSPPSGARATGGTAGSAGSLGTEAARNRGIVVDPSENDGACAIGPRAARSSATGAWLAGLSLAAVFAGRRARRVRRVPLRPATESTRFCADAPFVPVVGLEPTCPCGQRILNPPRMPFRHTGLCASYRGMYSAVYRRARGPAVLLLACRSRHARPPAALPRRSLCRRIRGHAGLRDGGRSDRRRGEEHVVGSP